LTNTLLDVYHRMSFMWYGDALKWQSVYIPYSLWVLYLLAAEKLGIGD